MREDEVHLPLVASDLVNRVLHETDVRREALGALLGNALTVPSELVEHNAGHDQLDQLLPDHFLDDADDSHLFRVFRDVKPYAGVDHNLEHGAHSILSPLLARQNAMMRDSTSGPAVLMSQVNPADSKGLIPSCPAKRILSFAARS